MDKDSNKLSYDDFRQQVCKLADKFIRDNKIFQIEVNFTVIQPLIVPPDKKDLTECTNFTCTLQ